MSQAIKMALISGLVFPGGGHMLMKLYIRAGLLAGASIVSLWVLLSIAMDKARDISLRIQSGEIPLDMDRITAEVSKIVSGSNTAQADIATYALIACWLVGIIDAYREGRLRDRRQAREEQAA